MQKITLEPDQTISINGAIIGKEIIDFLLELQLGISYSGMPPIGNNTGIEEYQKSYNELILFMASETENLLDKERTLSWFHCISLMRSMWDRFRIPGTEVIKLY